MVWRVDESRPRRGQSRVGRDIEEEAKLPLVVFPRGSSHEIGSRAAALRACAERYLPRLGSILFRGFPIEDSRAFRGFVASFLGGFREQSTANVVDTWRTDCALGTPSAGSLSARLVCRSSRARGTQPGACLQPERWYCRRHPRRIWIHCEAGTAKITIADTREVYSRIAEPVRNGWVERGLVVQRSFETDSSWRAAFRGADRQAVEAWCGAEGFGWQWQEGGGLRIHAARPAVIRHAVTGDTIWFNAAHGLSSLQRFGRLPAGMEILDGQGAALNAKDVRLVERAYQSAKSIVPCKAGDVLLIDNQLTAHALDARLDAATKLSFVSEYDEAVCEVDPLRAPIVAPGSS